MSSCATGSVEKNSSNSGGKNTSEIKSKKIESWSQKAPDKMIWSKAKEFCANLVEAGYSDWRLPTISELRTLIKNCPAMELGRECKVANDCLLYECGKDNCGGCSGGEDGRYSKFGDTEWL